MLIKGSIDIDNFTNDALVSDNATSTRIQIIIILLTCIIVFMGDKCMKE